MKAPPRRASRIRQKIGGESKRGAHIHEIALSRPIRAAVEPSPIRP